MYFIKVDTDAPYDLFDTWSKEIHNIALDICGNDNPKYIIFSDGNISYIMLLDYESNSLSNIDYTDSDITPVHCNPAVDMSLTTFGEFSEIHNLPYSENAIEDITVGDIVENYKEETIVSPSVYGDEIVQLCTFESFAYDNVDTSHLKSYINHKIISKGYDKEVFIGYTPQKHTRLELESELMRCNNEIYTSYKNIKIRNCLNCIVEKSRSKPEMEHGICGLLYEILCNCIVSCSGTTWYFIDGLWEDSPSDGYLWNFITTNFINSLINEGEEKIALHIMSVTIRLRIIKDLKLRLENNLFPKLLDSKRNIISMINGVYNTDTMTLLNPVPSDYVSVRAGVSYEVFDMDSYKMRKLITILSTIFSTNELLEFFILSCSTFLEGYNSPKVFYIWWGEGNNAKSLVQTLVMKTLGDYCSTAPTSLVTGKRTESSNATPDLCHIEKKLVVFLQEPNPEEKIKAGRIKEMTGNDSMYVRQLFKSGDTMTLKAKIVIVCNSVMEIPGMDAAIKRRIVVIPFLSTFLDVEEYTRRKLKGNLDENSRIIDLNVEKDLLDCKSAFMYLICKRYHEWVNESNMSFEMPDIIKAYTQDYITRNNYQLKFINLFLQRAEGGSVELSELYEFYKEWFRNSYPGKRVEDFERFTKELSDEGYKCDTHGIIHNVRLEYRD